VPRSKIDNHPTLNRMPNRQPILRHTTSEQTTLFGLASISKQRGSSLGCSIKKSIRVRLTVAFVHDLVNKLAVIVGHCDLLNDHLKGGSQYAKRVSAVQEIANWREAGESTNVMSRRPNKLLVAT
jgi:hypothetical protein